MFQKYISEEHMLQCCQSLVDNGSGSHMLLLLGRRRGSARRLLVLVLRACGRMKRSGLRWYTCGGMGERAIGGVFFFPRVHVMDEARKLHSRA
jgi:hypothetical protein